MTAIESSVAAVTVTAFVAYGLWRLARSPLRRAIPLRAIGAAATAILPDSQSCQHKGSSTAYRRGRLPIAESIAQSRLTCMSIQAIQIIELDRVEISVEPWRWEFAIAQRDQITRYFAQKKKEQPRLWNGQVLLMHRYTIGNRVLRGSCFTTEFADFLAWRDWNYPDPTVRDFFGAAGLCAADGAYLLGEMGLHTAQAGMCYFPCGTPEPADLDSSGVLNLVSNLQRELREETGLELQQREAAPGWTLVHDRGIFALIKRLTAEESGDQLRSRES